MRCGPLVQSRAELGASYPMAFWLPVTPPLIRRGTGERTLPFAQHVRGAGLQILPPPPPPPLQAAGLEVVVLDTSPGAVEVLQGSWRRAGAPCATRAELAAAAAVLRYVHPCRYNLGLLGGERPRRLALRTLATPGGVTSR